MSHMFEEIFEQPAVVAATIRDCADAVRALADEVERRGISCIYIAARGTSDHVAHYAKYAVEIAIGIPVALAAPSIFTLYGGVARLNSKVLVIGISQSGAGPDVNAVCRDAKALGALTACITNTEGSELARTVDHAIVTPAGNELSVAATKSYTSALAVIALLAAVMSDDAPRLLSELDRLPATLTDVLGSADGITEIAGAYRDISECVVLGRAYNHCTAAEVALKIMETSLIGVEAYSAADFAHGPIAIARPGLTCLLLAPSGPTLPNMNELSLRLVGIGCATIAFTDDGPLAGRSDAQVLLPTMPEWLSPIAYVVAGQLFAHALCIAKQLDPDRPRGLSKVTQTV